MAHDRRRHTRFPRLMKVSFEVDGVAGEGVTTDMSLGGAFINAPVGPDLGRRAKVRLVASFPVVFSGQVTRRLDLAQARSVLPGFAVVWEAAYAEVEPEALRRVLSELLNTPVRCRASREGGSVWVAGLQAPSRFDVERHAVLLGDLDRLYSGRPGSTPGVPADATLVRAPGFATGVEATCYVHREPYTGQVLDADLRSFTLACGRRLPDVGTAVVCQYRPAGGAPPAAAQVVGVVTETRGGTTPWIRVAVLRVIDAEVPAPGGGG